MAARQRVRADVSEADGVTGLVPERQPLAVLVPVTETSADSDVDLADDGVMAVVVAGPQAGVRQPRAARADAVVRDVDARLPVATSADDLLAHDHGDLQVSTRRLVEGRQRRRQDGEVDERADVCIDGQAQSAVSEPHRQVGDRVAQQPDGIDGDLDTCRGVRRGRGGGDGREGGQCRDAADQHHPVEQHGPSTVRRSSIIHRAGRARQS